MVSEIFSEIKNFGWPQPFRRGKFYFHASFSTAKSSLMTFDGLPPSRKQPHRVRKRGTLNIDEDRLRARYDAAVIGKRRGPALFGPIDLSSATGDPLAEQNPALTARLYGLSIASRPNVALRRISAKIFGDPLSSLADMAIWFQEHRGWSALRSAGEAAALAAERGTWIGNQAPISFDRAVELIRKAVGRAHVLGPLRAQPQAWTGDRLFVLPAPGRLVPIPAPAPPRTRLPQEGGWVKDDSYWRRCVRSGDVLLKDRSNENHPTIDETVAIV